MTSEQFAVAQFLKTVITESETVVYVCSEPYCSTDVNLLEEDMSRHYCYIRPSFDEDGGIDTFDVIQAAKSPFHAVLHDRLIYRYDVDGELLELLKKPALGGKPQLIYPSQSEEVIDMTSQLCRRLFISLTSGHHITMEEIAEINNEANEQLGIKAGEAAVIGVSEAKTLYHRERSEHFARVRQRRESGKGSSPER